MLGETLEWVTPKTRYVCEQVSHHPPICAAHMQTKDWEWEQFKEIKANFTGNAVTSPPVGTTRVTLSKRNETYTVARSRVLLVKCRRQSKNNFFLLSNVRSGLA